MKIADGDARTKKKKKRKNDRDKIFSTEEEGRDETQEGGKDGRWRVIREWLGR